MSIVFIPADWEVIDDIAVMDPDGWDRRNYKASWSEPITYQEWQRRMGMSTVASPLRNWKKVDEIRATRILATWEAHKPESEQ